jgi:hypothetical protein
MTYVDTAASVAAVAAVVGLLYARASARAAHDAAAAARRSLEIAERSRQAAARARLRLRVERVGQLVQDMAATAHVPSGSEALAPTALAQCQVLGRAVIGLNDILPKSVALSQASAVSELVDRAAVATAEIDGVLKKLNRHRSQSTYRPRHGVPWHRPAGVRSAVGASARGRSTVRHQQSP